MDTLTPQLRSERMGRVLGRDTTPELVVRRLLHGRGYRYVLNDRRLPGSPDLVFPRRRKVLFVHGCFWHRHPGCALSRFPKSREDFWRRKFDENQARDRRAYDLLAELGWDVMIVWECELRDLVEMGARMESFLNEDVRAK